MSTPDQQQLDVVQRWMFSVITHPDGVAAGVDSVSARKEIDLSGENLAKVIEPSHACTSLERLAVYGNAYTARLVECLEAEFPALRHLVGQDAFHSFSIDYLQKHPSTSPNLNDLGRMFPAFLADSRRQSPELHPEDDWADFLIEVATLERIYAEVFDGPGEEQTSSTFHEQLQRISPDAWAELRLETAESLRLFRFQYPVHEYVSAIRKEQAAGIPAPATTWLIVNRRNYVVRRQAVPETAWRVLRGLQRGLPMSVALEQAFEETSEEDPQFLDRIAEWFQTWTASGYFRNVIS